MKPSSKNGMTLVELLVASAILALALVPVSDLLLSNSRQTRMTIERLQASGRARMILDRYRCLDGAQLAQLFPADGSGSLQVATDRLLKVDSDDTAIAALDLSERQHAIELEERFADDVRFLAGGAGSSGRLVVRIAWISAASNRRQTLIASEQIAERSR